MSQIDRLHTSDIVDGKKAYAVAINNEFNQLVSAHNTNDTRMDSAETSISEHMNSASSDHDGRYILRGEIDTDTVAINYEVFTIVVENNGDGTFTYQDENNENISGVFEDGKQYFTLTKGSYTLNQNRIYALINDTLHRSLVTGGLYEINSNTIALDSQDAGAEITVIYFEELNNLMGVVSVSAVQPPNSYYGKLWIDTDA